MSRKIPLEATIGGAYGFLFSELLSIAGIAWFPLVVFGGLAGAAIWFGAIAHPLPPLHMDNDGQEFMRTNLPLFLALGRVASVVCLCVIAFSVMTLAGVTKLALGLFEGQTLFYFNLGASFWRMLGALLSVTILLGLLRAALQLVEWSWVRFAAPAMPAGIAIIVDVLGILVIVGLVIYVTFRLLMFLPAVVIAENRLGLGRAWALGAGNFWRAFVSLLAVLLPIGVAFGIVVGVLLDGFMKNFPLPPFAGEEHPGFAAFLPYAGRVLTFMGHAMAPLWPAFVALFIIYTIARSALYGGASVKAYRGMTAESE
jgi:hypothetical protein